MRLLKRRKGLDLRPVSESHEEFARTTPNYEELMAEAEAEAAEVERRYEQAVASGSPDPMAEAWGEEPAPQGTRRRWWQRAVSSSA